MLVENIRLALHNLGANKMRTFLTMLGIIIGIASVIAIITIGSSQTKDYEKREAAGGINNIEIMVWSSAETEEYRPIGFSEEAMEGMISKYADQIEAISAESYGGSGKIYAYSTKLDSEYSQAFIIGVTNGFFKVRNVRLIAGSYFSREALERGSNVCIISDLAVKYLFGGDNERAIGKQITFSTEDGYQNYSVCGVYSYQFDASAMRGGKMKEQDIQCGMYVPFLLPVNSATFEDADIISYFTLQAKAGVDVIELSEQLRSYLQGTFKAEDKAEVNTWNNKEMIQEQTAELKRQTRTTSVIGAIALLVGGIGVMNIMTVTIIERTREIGTRKALGAPNRAIRMQFITEAVVMCVLGGIIGLIAGVVAGAIGCRMNKYALYVPFSSALLAFGVSLAIGLFFGYYPANKAAKMDPIDALRYE